MRTSAGKFKSTIVALFVGMGCGVKTGNPGPSPGSPRPPTSATNLLLNVKELALGRLVISIKSVELIPVGEKWESSKGVKVLSDLKEPIETGGGSINLPLDVLIPAGKYDKIKLVLNDTKPLALYDKNKKEQPVTIDFSAFFANGSGTSIFQIPSVISGQIAGGGGLTLPNVSGTGSTPSTLNGAGSQSIIDILNGSGSQLVTGILGGSGTQSVTTVSSGSSGSSGSGITSPSVSTSQGTAMVKPTALFDFGSFPLEISSSQSKNIDVTADLNKNLEQRMINAGTANEVVEYFFNPIVTALEYKVTITGGDPASPK